MSEKQRAEFEKWAADKYILERSKSGAYMSVPTRQAFECWQAAIASVVVELPEYVANSHIRNIAIDECKTSLDRAGIRYE